jgi:hypothetical protein
MLNVLPEAMEFLGKNKGEMNTADVGKILPLLPVTYKCFSSQPEPQVANLKLSPRIWKLVISTQKLFNCWYISHKLSSTYMFL